MNVVILRVSQIEPDRLQPRKYFDPKALNDLADSILEYGVIEPIIVRPQSNGFYKIISGERRWRATRIANIKEIPAIIKGNISEVDAFKMAFAENLQRESLTPIEEALGFMHMINDLSMTQEEVSNAVKRSRSSIANIIRLLRLPQTVQDLISKGSLSVAHAKQILSVDSKYQEELAYKTVQEGLSVKALEREVKRINALKKHTGAKPVQYKDTFYTETELSLKDILSRPVRIDGNGKKGTITLEFYGKEDLKNISNTLAKLYNLK